MCQNHPQTEKQTVWGYTEEEIEHRWKVHHKFDPLTRLFGDKDSNSNSEQSAPKVNNASMLGFLENFLSEGNGDG
jgi:hypothetical protein